MKYGIELTLVKNGEPSMKAFWEADLGRMIDMECLFEAIQTLAKAQFQVWGMSEEHTCERCGHEDSSLGAAKCRRVYRG